MPLTPKDLGGPAQPVLSVRGLVKHFPLKKDVFGKGGGVVRAVDGVDFEVFKGETLGVVGESGCGKSTTARLLMQLIIQDQGELVFDGQTVGGSALPLKAYRRQTQMVFQDSYASLNPRLTIEDSIAFGPMVHGVPHHEAVARARDLLARVGLAPERFAERYPHELSGGQRQRVNIARALALQSRLIILDEAVSALDKSVEAQVLNLLLDLKEDFGLTYVFISHDLNVVRYMSDRVLVMYLGQVVEIGDSETLFNNPAHPYTQALLSSIPTLDPDRRTEKPPLAGDPPNPINPPAGCRFHPRCVHAQAICSQKMPELADTAHGQQVACWMHVSGSAHSLAPNHPSGAAPQEMA
jgi:peptide/nickel transport system ATP-binding protein